MHAVNAEFIVHFFPIQLLWGFFFNFLMQKNVYISAFRIKKPDLIYLVDVIDETRRGFQPSFMLSDWAPLVNDRIWQ